MSLRDKFISYTEAARNAEQLLHQHGPTDINVVKAFEYSNELKREVLDRMEELERLVDE